MSSSSSTASSSLTLTEIALSPAPLLLEQQQLQLLPMVPSTRLHAAYETCSRVSTTDTAFSFHARSFYTKRVLLAHFQTGPRRSELSRSVELIWL